MVTYSGISKDLAGPGLAHALHVALLVLDVPQGVGDYLQARKSSKHLFFFIRQTRFLAKNTQNYSLLGYRVREENGFFSPNIVSKFYSNTDLTSQSPTCYLKGSG